VVEHHQAAQEALLERLGPEAPDVLGSWLGALDHDVDPRRRLQSTTHRTSTHGDLTAPP
jgi:hypothetical protein